jgi:uncharacterized repeat protein (TIGR03803 family)
MKTSFCTHKSKAAVLGEFSLAVVTVSMFLFFLVVHPISVRAQTFSDLHDFNCDHDGCDPRLSGIVAQGTDGNLYGTLAEGGAGCGSVFRITPSGALNDLYNFSGADGCNPLSGLTLGTDGDFYGTTGNGGSNSIGTIFKITSTGGLTTLHNFTSAEGGSPYSPPVQGKKAFYGVTSKGTAYTITSAGTFKLLHHKIPGASYAPLFLASDSHFYGTTASGGSHGYGTVFRLSASGVVTTIYDFDFSHGAYPSGPVVQGSDKNLYGLAYEGGSQESPGGVVFKVTLTGAITVLHSFDGGSLTDGAYPSDGLLLGTDGNFYGSTFGNGVGGTGYYGTLFKIDAKGNYTELHDFDETHGANPVATAMQHTNGILYGTTSVGGATNSGVFWNLNNQISPFVSIVGIPAAKVNQLVEILGQGFTTASSVKFGSILSNFTVYSDTYLTAVVPSAAKKGTISVTTSKGTFVSRQTFKVLH